MARKRVTDIFPFILPVRKWQRRMVYFMKMRFDKNKYSITKGDILPYEVSNTKTWMVNENSGYDIKYQKNKVENLQIASKTMNKILIYPGEVFSFCYLEKNSKKYGKYKDGLVLVNNKIVAQNGGGLCQLSNLIHYLCLMSPLTIMERHGHRVKSLPNTDKDALEGIDATVSSGWLDLKVKNNTEDIYQLVIDFDDEYMYGKIMSNKMPEFDYEIMNEDFKYIRRDNKIYESVSVVKLKKDIASCEVVEKNKLYNEVVEVTFKLPDDVKVEEDNNEEN